MSLTFNKEMKPGVHYNDPKKPSLTKQSFLKDCDYNRIVGRYLETGQLGNPVNGNLKQPFYGDFSQYPDLARSLEIQRDAAELWDRLPASLRLRFGNDPVALMTFVQDEGNREEARKLGLLKPETPPDDTLTKSAFKEVMAETFAEKPVKKGAKATE